MNNEETKNEIKKLLSSLMITDCIEILANVLIDIGVENLILEDQENIIQAVISHRKRHGETLGSALAMQGFSMLIWLENGNQVK